MTEVAFRPAASAHERRFVIDAWCGTYRDAFTAGLIQVEDWYAVMIPGLGKVLDKPDVRTIVACTPGVADGVADLLGFIVADTVDVPPLVYYVFVKEHYRRGGAGRIWSGPGLGRQLFAAAGVDPGQPFNFVCSTPICRMLERKTPMARWRPLLGRFPNLSSAHRRRRSGRCRRSPPRRGPRSGPASLCGGSGSPIARSSCRGCRAVRRSRRASRRTVGCMRWSSCAT
jgi:hypothetical protein